MLKSRETLIQDAKNAIKEPKQLAMVLDLIDSAWQWRTGGAQEATRERWVTVGGQTKKGSTTDEAGPKTQDGGQTSIPAVGTAGPQGERGPAGAAGPAGAIGPAGATGATGPAGADGKDGADGAPGSVGAEGPAGPIGPAGPTINHDLLPGLNAGDYQHLTAAQKADLTDAGDSSLHFHSADRARANHTGTQLASTISDFSAAADTRIALQKGAANGVATLDSNIKIPLAQIPDALIGQVKFQALWNQTTNSPSLPATPAAGTKGYYWICMDAAQATFQGLALNTGDWLIVNGNEGSLSWGKVDNTDSVTSVFGRTGTITAQSSDYASFYQPLDSDLTAIAALATTSYGRSFLTIADAAAARTLIGAQAAGNYLPLAAGSGSPLTGTLYGPGVYVKTDGGAVNFFDSTRVYKAVGGGLRFRSNSGNTRPMFEDSTGSAWTIWDAGNLTGDQSAHYHSEDRKWENITGKPSFSYQPLEDQRLSSLDEPTFASVTAFKLFPTDISTSEIGGPTNFWYSSFINKNFSNEVKVAYGGNPLTPFSTQNFIRISSLSSQCGYITGYQSGSQTFSIDGKYGSMSMIGGVGMFGSTPPPSKILVTGSKFGNAALASLISALVAFGMISDSTT